MGHKPLDVTFGQTFPTQNKNEKNWIYFFIFEDITLFEAKPYNFGLPFPHYFNFQIVQFI